MSNVHWLNGIDPQNGGKYIFCTFYGGAFVLARGQYINKKFAQCIIHYPLYSFVNCKKSQDKIRATFQELLLPDTTDELFNNFKLRFRFNWNIVTLHNYTGHVAHFPLVECALLKIVLMMCYFISSTAFLLTCPIDITVNFEIIWHTKF